MAEPEELLSVQDMLHRPLGNVSPGFADEMKAGLPAAPVVAEPQRELPPVPETADIQDPSKGLSTGQKVARFLYLVGNGLAGQGHEAMRNVQALDKARQEQVANQGVMQGIAQVSKLISKGDAPGAEAYHQQLLANPYYTKFAGAALEKLGKQIADAKVRNAATYVAGRLHEPGVAINDLMGDPDFQERFSQLPEGHQRLWLAAAEKLAGNKPHYFTLGDTHYELYPGKEPRAVASKDQVDRAGDYTTHFQANDEGKLMAIRMHRGTGDLETQDTGIRVAPHQKNLHFGTRILPDNTMQVDGRDPLSGKVVFSENVGPVRPPASLAGPEMNDKALEMNARQLLKEGTFPPGLSRNKVTVTKVWNKAAEIAEAEGIPFDAMALSHALYKTDVGELQKLKNQYGPVMSFEKTATANLGVAEQAYNKVAAKNLPLLNMPIQALQRVTGNPDITALDTALRTATTEVARVLQSANAGSTVLSDAARKEAENMLKGTMSPAQFMASLRVIKQDLSNRKAGFEAQIAETQGRIKQQPGPAGQAAPAPAATGGPTYQGKPLSPGMTSASGKYVWDGNAWQPKK